LKPWNAGVRVSRRVGYDDGSGFNRSGVWSLDGLALSPPLEVGMSLFLREDRHRLCQDLAGWTCNFMRVSTASGRERAVPWCDGGSASCGLVDRDAWVDQSRDCRPSRFALFLLDDGAERPGAQGDCGDR